MKVYKINRKFESGIALIIGRGGITDGVMLHAAYLGRRMCLAD
jgi:hypothetical protein